MSALATETVELARPPDDIRNGVRQALTSATMFDGLNAEDRRSIAHALVRIAHAAKLLEDEAGESAPAPPAARAMNAGDEFSGAAVDRMASTTRRMLNAISFPRFVSELIIGVFRAIVETNQTQLQQYVELVRGVSQSLDGFASVGGNDDMARRWLAEQFPQSYEIEAPDPEDRPDPGDEPEPMRLRSVGPPPSSDAMRTALGLEANAEIPSSGGEAMVPFVRRSLARNRQQMLATMVQMGMQRIVIDSGRINASMRFHIDASSAAAEDRSNRFDTRTTVGMSGSVGFGWWSASASVNSTIGYVSTTDVSTRENLTASADLNSSVELHFRTDQVPLDRIASTQTVERLKLNTLNPERELEISRQADAERMANRRELETARAAFKPRVEAAPPLTATAPAAPPLDTTVIADRARAALGSGGTNTAAGRGATNPPAAGGATNPPAAGGATNPPAAGSATNPPAAGGASNPPAAGAVTNPPAAGGATNPPAAGGATNPPAAGGATNPPAAGGTANPPAAGSGPAPATPRT